MSIYWYLLEYMYGNNRRPPLDGPSVMKEFIQFITVITYYNLAALKERIFVSGNN